MKRIFSILILLAICIQIHAQKKTREYYYWINQAELAICDSDFHKSSIYYDQAFHCLPPQAKDLCNAFLLNIYNDNAPKILEYAHLLCQCGFENPARMYQYYHGKDTLLLQSLKDIADTTQSTVISALIDTLNTILNRDQSLSHVDGDKLELTELYKRNLHQFLTLYRGYPHINTFTASIDYPFLIKAPAMHFAEHDIHRFQLLLKKQVKKGELSPIYYMDLEDLYLSAKYFSQDKKKIENKTFASGINHIYAVGNTLFITRPCFIKKVNKRRSRLLVAETFDDFIKKMKFQFEQGDFYFYTLNTIKYGSNDDDINEANRLKSEINIEHKNGDFSRTYYESEPKND